MDALSHSVTLCENIFNKPSFPNRKCKGAEILTVGSPSPTCHVSGVTCHMSLVKIHLLHVTCQESDFLCEASKLASGGSVINGAYPSRPIQSKKLQCLSVLEFVYPILWQPEPRELSPSDQRAYR